MKTGGKTALMIAAEHGQKEVVKVFLKHNKKLVQMKINRERWRRFGIYLGS